LELRESNFSLDTLLQETLELTAFMGMQKEEAKKVDEFKQSSLFEDEDYLMDLADSILEEPVEFNDQVSTIEIVPNNLSKYPESSGIIYKIDDAGNTFCIRGFSVSNILEGMQDLTNIDSCKRAVLKLAKTENFENVFYFKTKNFELAESIREQIINRRFPKIEDSVCNISDPGFSWWMDVSLTKDEGKFEIFFKAHAINRAEKYIQLGPIGDGAIASLRMNQARTLLRSSFPMTEFVCTDRSLTVATSKPDHLSFISFKNIFLLGENHTEEENFPDNSLGRTLYFYFHEIAVLRKFWIEVHTRLS
jgi:hypothetical protein